MIIFLTDQQQNKIDRDLIKASAVLNDLIVMAEAFKTMGWTGPEHRMSADQYDLSTALRSIAKTMQDASGVEPVAVVDEKMGEGV